MKIWKVSINESVITENINSKWGNVLIEKLLIMSNFCFLPECFQMASAGDAWTCVCMWERVKIVCMSEMVNIIKWFFLFFSGRTNLEMELLQRKGDLSVPLRTAKKHCFCKLDTLLDMLVLALLGKKSEGLYIGWWYCSCHPLLTFSCEAIESTVFS